MGNSPVNYVGPTGRKPNTVTALLGTSCVAGLGHIAVLITDDTDAYYFSFAPDNATGADAASWGPGKVSSNHIKGEASKSTVEIMARVNLEERKGKKSDQYDYGFEFTLSPKRVSGALKSAQEREAEDLIIG